MILSVLSCHKILEAVKQKNKSKAEKAVQGLIKTLREFTGKFVEGLEL
jgi:hypothetical protein